MKIAYIGQKGIPAKQGGIERHVEELSQRVAEAGFDVFVYSRPHYTLNHKNKYKNIHIVSMPSINTKHLDAISHTLFSTFHALFHSYDVIHYHGVGPSLLSWIPRLLKPRTKIISTFHCIDRKHQKWNKLAQYILGLGERATCKFPHQTIVVSKVLQKYCKEKFNHVTSYIPNGVSILNTKSNTEILQKHDLKKNDYILAASRLVRHKGIHTLIEAYNKLKTDKKLVIAGAGANTLDYVNEIKAMAKSNKNIIFVGQQTGSDLKALFENTYLFVQPSEAEGLSIALLESMLYGLPIVSSDIEENMELVKGLSLQFKNKDVDDLAKQLKYALKYPEVINKTAVKAKELAGRDYNWDNITKQTIDIYKQPIHYPFAMRLKTTHR
jgi:glycosyltransferase involved in cell wall biosynthesis